ncbi:MAG: DUF1571 domain-containing protein [Sphingobacteriaceae bacterium]|nr:DUF1571 domain-containing protein [Sphingobacteriaceae bacterium]
MKRFGYYFYPVLIPAILLCSFSGKDEVNAVKLLSQMNDSIKNIQTLRVKIFALERIEKKYLSANSEIKLQTSPRKLYFINPQKKLEILFIEKENGDKAIVKPHVFPYFTMLLDPRGNLMRKNQHYTIHELGFDFIGKSVALTISKDKEGTKHFRYHGLVTRNGKKCHYIEYENKSYGYVNYVVKEKETVTSIAYTNIVNDYLIRYHNDLVNDFGYLKKGRTIQIPNLYCKKAVLFIDEKMMLPIEISLYDEMGIFENYTFSDIVKNGVINTEEFSRQ